MAHKIATWLVVPATFLASACSVPTETADRSAQAAEAIMQADRDFSALAKVEGLSEAFGVYMDSVDGRLIRGGGEPTVGEAAIRESFANFPATTVLHWYPVEAFSGPAGDFGVSWGWYEVHGDADIETPADERGQYVTAWRLNADGEWRGILDMGTRDESYEPPVAETMEAADTSEETEPDETPAADE